MFPKTINETLLPYCVPGLQVTPFRKRKGEIMLQDKIYFDMPKYSMWRKVSTLQCSLWDPWTQAVPYIPLPVKKSGYSSMEEVEGVCF